MQRNKNYAILYKKEDKMGYILVEDIIDEMSKDITYIKLNSYLKERKKS